jgi:1-deoxy-D-xylulose-5-phosphate reductoisomerase
MKKAMILGCTGSIGTTAIKAIEERQLPIEVVAVSAHRNSDRLQQTAHRLGCRAVCLTGAECPPSDRFSTYGGPEGLQEMVREVDADIVLNAIAGFDGLRATLACIESGKDIALANKESVVCGGSYLFDRARDHGVSIIPVDSEHSAIYELLKTRKRDSVESLVITASGGPFRTLPKDRFAAITAEQALNHPTWNMGKKITIDSATLANKALEVMEASYLFGFPPDRIEVVVHPQSIVHSMIRTKDGAIYAQMGPPDMTLPIINALTDNTSSLVRPLSFADLSLTFERPDFERFPLLGLAFSILREGGAAPIAFNAADEVAVHAFLEGRVSYPRMISAVVRTMERCWGPAPADFGQTTEIDRKARLLARSLL